MLPRGTEEAGCKDFSQIFDKTDFYFLWIQVL